MKADATPRPLAPSPAYTSTALRESRSRAAGWLRSVPGCLAGLALALAACSDADPAAPSMVPPPTARAPEIGHVPLSGGCVDGAVEPCSEVLGEHDGILSCVAGTRLCAGGVFGACEGNELYEMPKSESAPVSGLAARPLAFSTATDCTNNPCNRYCKEFNEAPPQGLVPYYDNSAPPLSSWLTGNVSDYPPEWVVVGKQEPCQVSNDCQFNTECVDPSRGSCSHSVCSTGSALTAGCNRCADSVCAVEPDCCGVPPTCDHDPCEVGNGGPLDPTCDACVGTICENHPECCSVSWDETCVGYVATECQGTGQSCSCPAGGVEHDGTCYVGGDVPGGWFEARDACGGFGVGWQVIEINDADENDVARRMVTSAGNGQVWLGATEQSVDTWTWQSGDVFFVSDASGGQLQAGYTYENWADGEPELNVAGRGIALDAQGDWYDAPISTPFGYVCEGPKNRLGPKVSPYRWDERCTELAVSACGVTCSDGPALGIGACTARVPTELDTGCTSYDLALGATCEANDVPQIPVCNHGQAVAPAGLRLVHLPMDEMGRQTPDLSAAEECELTEAIPPGRCVTVTNCNNLSADRALVVNPVAPDNSHDDTECRLDDNWSIYQPLACRATTCESSVHDATLVKAAGCGVRLQNPLGVDSALAQVVLGTEVPEPTCGPGEVLRGTSCYFVATRADTWDAAQDTCRGRGPGWDLVSVNSPDENTWLRQQVDPLRDIQIGFTDAVTEGDHVWSDGSCRAYTNWDTLSSSPNNSPPGSEQCTRITALGTWEDVPCNDGQHPYVCEGPVIDARGGCDSGQLTGPDGSCYSFDPAPVSVGTARDTCADIGPGWKLASIEDAGTNAFVTSLIGCTETWLNNPPGAFANWAPAESVDLSIEPFMDALGIWHATTDTNDRATLCQGPSTATSAPVLAQVNDVADCSASDDRQYYFTGNDTAPETLQLCPATCNAAAALAGRRIGVEIGCAPPPPPALVTEHVQVYAPDCPGTQPQWDFLYYDAVTPADSRVEFAIRTASTTAELDADTTAYVTVAQAHAVPTDTQSCETVSAACPVDIFHPLGDNEQTQQIELLQLRVRLIPGSSGEGPVVRDWKIRFSCPPAQ